MKTRRATTRKHLAAGVYLLMLFMSVAVPVLERADIVTEPVAESEHNPSECPPGHDHTVCTQAGANSSALASGSAEQLPTAVVRVTLPIFDPAGRPSVLQVGHPSRAPPLA